MIGRHSARCLLVTLAADHVTLRAKLANDHFERRTALLTPHFFSIALERLFLELDHPRRENQSSRRESQVEARVVPRSTLARPKPEIEMVLVERPRALPKPASLLHRFDRTTDFRNRVDLRIELPETRPQSLHERLCRFDDGPSKFRFVRLEPRPVSVVRKLAEKAERALRKTKKGHEPFLPGSVISAPARTSTRTFRSTPTRT